MSTAIATIEEIEQHDALAVFTAERGLDPYLSLIRAEIEAFVPDMTTRKGRSEIASMAAKVAKSKTYLDGVGKALVDRLKEQPKLVDAERKRMRDLLDAWKDEVRRPLTDYENAEAERIHALKDRMERLRPTISAGMTVEALRAVLLQIEAIAIDDTWQEFAADAGKQKDLTVAYLRSAIAEQAQREAEQRELARLQAEKSEQERIEREARIAKEAEERGRIEAERKAQAEVNAAAERVRLAKLAEEKAIADQQRAEQLARERLEREKAEAEAAEAKRKANLAHRKECVAAAIHDLMEVSRLTEEQAQTVIEAIEFGSIRHIGMYW